MCNANCITFGRKYLSPLEVRGKRVLEVGAYDVNGSLRSVVEPMGPSEYIGVDIVGGYGVDIVCGAEDICDRFGGQSFDVVLSTELIEHVLDWRKAISNFKNICKPGGVILLTTRSKGFEYHGWPHDFWRFEASDMERIFSDFNIEKIESDEMEPGVFLKARRPIDFHEKDLSELGLYSVIDGKRMLNIDEAVLADFIRVRADAFQAIGRLSLGSRVRRIVRDGGWKIRGIWRKPR